jgi:hypothetical protein
VFSTRHVPSSGRANEKANGENDEEVKTASLLNLPAGLRIFAQDSVVPRVSSFVLQMMARNL